MFWTLERDELGLEKIFDCMSEGVGRFRVLDITDIQNPTPEKAIGLSQYSFS